MDRGLQMDSSARRLAPRTYGAVNWLGLWTLYLKEVRRFLKVAMQTVLAPVVSTLLFMMVFAIAVGQGRGDVLGVRYNDFVAPGLIMMALLSNAFANSSSSLVQAKLMGSSVDFLMPPLSPSELTTAFLAGAVTRGIIVAFASILACAPFADIVPAHGWAVAYFGLTAALMFGAIGIIGGLWSEKFDHIAAVTNFVVTPLTFLSGAFYSTAMLPEPFASVAHWNPVFHLIDGFRYGFIGAADGDVFTHIWWTMLVTALVCLWAWLLVRRGYRLKA